MNRKVSYLLLFALVLSLSACDAKKSDENESGKIKGEEYLYNIYYGELCGVYFKDNIEYENNILGLGKEDNLKKGYIIDPHGNDAIVEGIKTKFSMDENCETVTENGMEFERSIRVWENGYIEYKFEPVDIEKYFHEAKDFELTYEEYTKIADDFLTDIGFMDETIIRDYVEVKDDVQTEKKGNSKTISKGVSYDKYIDGVKVYSQYAASIGVNAYGQVTRCYIPNMKVLDEFEISNKYVVELKDAIEQAKKFKGLVSMNQVTERVELEKAQVLYYADAYPTSEEMAIIPIYKIEGKAFVGDNEIGEVVCYESATVVEE